VALPLLYRNSEDCVSIFQKIKEKFSKKRLPDVIITTNHPGDGSLEFELRFNAAIKPTGKDGDLMVYIDGFSMVSTSEHAKDFIESQSIGTVRGTASILLSSCAQQVSTVPDEGLSKTRISKPTTIAELAPKPDPKSLN
jgi:hypothetical protein